MFAKCHKKTLFQRAVARLYVKTTGKWQGLIAALAFWVQELEGILHNINGHGFFGLEGLCHIELKFVFPEMKIPESVDMSFYRNRDYDVD